MYVLGIETTCDETSVSIVKDGFEIISHKISTQIDLHAQFGGVVPELACRRHAEVIGPIFTEVLNESNLSLSEIDLISVAKGPGLIGALLIGINFAKGLAMAANKPLVGVNHIEAHLYAAMMSKPPAELVFPALGVVLSGGHTSLIYIEAIGNYKLIGETIDDAIGEAFDKVAKILDLPYPGGPHVELLAREGNPKAYDFKPVKIKGRPFDFSFSGIKTSVLYTAKGNNLQRTTPLSDEEKRGISASFQARVFSEVREKIERALQSKPLIRGIYLGGGVTRNKALRHMLIQAIDIPIFWPEPELCLDNGAMIAGLAYHKWQGVNELLSLEPETRIPFQ